MRFLMEASNVLARAKTARRERDERIATMIRYRRASVSEIMGVTGLAKARIYQIFERTYGFPVSQIERPGA